MTPASIIDADQIRSILKEIFDIRQSKLRKSIEIFFKVLLMNSLEKDNFIAAPLRINEIGRLGCKLIQTVENRTAENSVAVSLDRDLLINFSGRCTCR